MTRVSTQKISRTVLSKIGRMLVAEIARAKTISQAEAFVDELLTDSERVMLAKRFMIVFLLENGASYSYIEKTLKVSISTIARMQRKRLNGDFNLLIKRCGVSYKRKSKSGKRESVLEVILRAGLPPIAGRGRWKYLYESTAEIKKSK